MDNYNEINVFDEIRNNISIRKSGKYIGIPFYKIFSRFGESFPTLEKGHQGMLTAASGIGKTHWWIEMLLFRLWMFINSERLANRYIGFKPIFKIALLENTKREFEYRLLSRILAYVTKQIYPAKMLKGRADKLLPDEVLVKHEKEVSIIFNEIMSWCTIITNIYNPTGLYKWAREESNKHGTHTYKTISIEGKDVKVYDRYIQNDEEEHIIMILDNSNNLIEEKGAETQHLAIRKWYRNYGRLQITKHWQWTLVNIHQQASDVEKQEFSYGKSIMSKLKPSAAGLGNNKEVQRDCHFIWGLFNPYKYEIADYEGYDITILMNFFRSLLLAKQNDGIADVEFPFYFHGGASIMVELPKPNKINYKNYILE